jgi:PPOX class probable F420-dependent enzyme
MTIDQLWHIISSNRNGILATTNADGSPQLSNIYYLTDPEDRVIRFSTTTDRVKGRNLLRNPRAALHVSGKNFLNYAVALGDAMLFVAHAPDDPAIDELLEIHEALSASPARAGFGREMVAAGRMAVRLNVTRLYGQVLEREPRRSRRDTETK